MGSVSKGGDHKNPTVYGLVLVYVTPWAVKDNEGMPVRVIWAPSKML